MRNRLLGGALLLAMTATPAAAQKLLPGGASLASGVHHHAYSFDEGLGASSASLTLIPVAYQQPLGRRALLEAYTSYGWGAVQLDGRDYRFDGLTDTWVRSSYAFSNTMVATIGLNLPTGHPKHDTEQAVVATVLSTDILGFREASWGVGLAVTGGLSTMRTIGDWNVSGGASYRSNGEFEPRADTSVTYSAGDEMRLRVAASRPVGEGKTLSVGGMLLNYTEDQLDGRNLFQSGLRAMLDASYAFEVRGNRWTAFIADIWRDRGDVTLPIVTQASTVRKDSTYQIGRQNLFVVGAAGELRLRNGTLVRPGIDLRLQGGEETGAAGWLLGAGGDVPLRRGAFEFFPSARITVGSIESAEARGVGFWGAELAFVIRHAPVPIAVPRTPERPGRN